MSQLNPYGENIDSINIDVLLDIEKELEAIDLISLVFLIYEEPNIAQQRLKDFELISGKNLLYEWAVKAESRPTWKHEFLEALAICQLYSIIKKLGFNLHKVKDHYCPQNIHRSIYINPMKKALYKLCENITTENLLKLKKPLITYNVDIEIYKHFELILLQLMCQKYITLNHFNNIGFGGQCQIGRLIKIIDNISELKRFSNDIKDIENRINSTYSASILPLSIKVDENLQNYANNNTTGNNCDSTINTPLLRTNTNELNEINSRFQNVISDTKKFSEDAYVIKNKKKVGVCYIINQKRFFPSKTSIEQNGKKQLLKDRIDSTKDIKLLETTMSLLNFEVITHSNLDYERMIQNLKDIITYRVHYDVSVFMLCILSYGGKDHVYTADSVKMKIEDIQSLLDSDMARNLHSIPKVLIINAWGVKNDEPMWQFVSDAPTSNYYLRKVDFLVYCAISVQEASIDEETGSVFIKILCRHIRDNAKHEHLYDIFTKVNDILINANQKQKSVEGPAFESTLRKKLYLQIPN